MNENQNTPIDPEMNKGGENASIEPKEDPANTETAAKDNIRETDSVESTQAFKWDYTDKDGKAETTNEQNEDLSAPTAPEDQIADGEAVTETIKKESENKTEETVEEKSEEKPAEVKAEKPTRKKRSFALGAACILSSVSILLLLTLSLSVFLGIIPINPTYTPSTNNTPTSPEEDADPALIEDFLNSVVIVKGTGITSISTGTGVIISTDGYIITNYHVIEGCSSVTVELYGESTAEKAEVIGYHEDDDVAVLKIKRSELRAATFVDSETVRYGEKVYAIVHPTQP